MFGDNYVSLTESENWFVRLWRRYRPPTGWGIFLLTLSAVVLLPAALVDGELIPGLGPAIPLAMAGFLFGWWLAHRSLSGPLAALFIALAGIVADLLWGVFALRPGALVAQLAGWWTWALGDRIDPAPAVTFFREQGAELGRYFERVAIWVRGLILGPGAADNLAAIGIVALLAWLVAAWAAWWVARRHEPFVALLPTGVFLAQQAFWTPDTISYILIFLAVTVFLLVLSRLVFQTREWDAAGVDYADDIRLDVLFAGLALTMLVTFAAPALPFVASPQFSAKFWTLFESPWRRIESQVSASFEASRPVRSLVPATGAEPGGLPRAHLLGGRPELGKEIALRVKVRGDLSDLQLYWRGQTYAEYTGRGWESGAEASEIVSLPAGQPWSEELTSTSGRRAVLAAVRVEQASRAVLYAPGEPVSVDRPYRSILRGPGDLVALSPAGAAGEYTALSYVPEQDAGRMRAAGKDYPPSVTARHLQLPAGLDPRLPAYAARVTAGAETPYDAAVAIEQELRKIPYSLDVPTPPEGRELVSWFLFDLKTGYCDYYASAMVVLARLSGIPARLAIGYATGDLDEKTGEYVVTELSAHTWPELYFPGIGWVPFEPTAYLPAPPRPAAAARPPPQAGTPSGPEDLSMGLAEIRQSAQENAVVERRAAAGRGAWAALFGLTLLWAGWLRHTSTLPAPGSAGEALRAFERFARWGRRVGRPLAAGETAREYALGVARAVEQGGARAPDAASVVRQEGTALARDVERSLFAPDASEAGLRKRPALWAALRRAWVARRLSGRRGPAGRS